MAVPRIVLNGYDTNKPESDTLTGAFSHDNVRELTNASGTYTRITGYNWTLIGEGENQHYDGQTNNGWGTIDVKSTGVEIKTDKPENPDLKVSDVRIDRISGCLNNSSLIVSPSVNFDKPVTIKHWLYVNSLSQFAGLAIFKNEVKFGYNDIVINAEDDKSYETTPKLRVNKSGKITSQDTIRAKAFYTDSDKRLKKIIGDLNIDIDKILELSLIYYTFNNDPSKKEEIGVIAQEIREVCPQIVSEDENGMLSVDYSKLSILALYCIKDLYGKLKKD